MRKAVEILRRTREGREALLDIIVQSGVWVATSESEPLKLAFENGKRRVGADVIQFLLTDEDDAFTLLMRERFIRAQGNKTEEEDDD